VKNPLLPLLSQQLARFPALVKAIAPLPPKYGQRPNGNGLTTIVYGLPQRFGLALKEIILPGSMNVPLGRIKSVRACPELNHLPPRRLPSLMPITSNN
jgi:hypothetical protein